MKKLLEALAATAEVMGQTISPTAIAVMAQDLSGYPPESLMKALKHVRANARRFSLNSIIEALDVVSPDGRPNSDEAWATAYLANDEAETVVWTTEMQEAFYVARPLLEFGDKYGARKAFIDAYERITREAREKKTPIEWSASLGFDSERRDHVLSKAVSLGRLPAAYAAKLLPSPVDVWPFMAMLTNNASPLRLVSKDGEIQAVELDNETARERITKIKTMLKNKGAA